MKHTLAIIGLFCTSSIFAQQNTVSSGGDASGSGGSASYTVGQIDYTSIDGTGGNVNQGVQQPYEFFLSVGMDENASIVNSIYPNPTTSNVIIELNNLYDDLHLTLTDSKGRLIFNHSVFSLTSEINMSELSSGYYHLTLSTKTKTIEHIKIIKN